MSKKHCLRHLAGASGLAVTILLGVGCGTQVVNRQEPPQETHPSSIEYLEPVSEDERRRIEQAQDSFESWAGSVTDHQAAAVVNAYIWNGGRAECLAERGVRWAWQLGIGDARPRRFYESHPLFAPPDRFLSFYSRVNAEVSRLEPQRRITPDHEVVESINSCGSETAGTTKILGKLSEEQVQEVLFPTVVEELQAAWFNELRRSSNEMGGSEAGYDCLEQTAIETGPLSCVPAGEAGDRWATIFDEALSKAGPAPLDGEAPSDAWTDVLEIESQIVSALWSCHEDTFTTATSRLPVLVSTFEDSHSDAIARAEASWRNLRDIAGQLGWTPDDPSLASE